MWKTVKLGDVCELIGGGTPSKREESFYGGNIRWATVRDMSSDELTTTEHSITEDALRNSSSKIIPKDNVIIASRVGLGKVCILKQDTAINQDLRGVIPKRKDLIEVKFLFYWFKSISNKIIEAGRGATVQGVTLPFLTSLEFPLPPLAEQQRIVEKLDRAFEEIDRAIEATERKQEEVSALKSAVLSRELNSSDLGGTVKLGEICQLRNGRAYSKAELLSEGKYPVLRVGNFFTSDKWYYSDLELEDSKYCDCGDLLYAWSASFGPQIWSGEKVIYHYHIWRVDIDSQLVDKKFLFYWFEHDKELIKKASGTGTTMLHVSKGSMEKRELSLPPLAEQQKIVEKLDQVFSSANEAWEYFSTQLEHYKQLKSAILAQELKGPES